MFDHSYTYKIIYTDNLQDKYFGLSRGCLELELTTLK